MPRDTLYLLSSWCQLTLKTVSYRFAMQSKCRHSWVIVLLPIFGPSDKWNLESFSVSQSFQENYQFPNRAFRNWAQRFLKGTRVCFHLEELALFSHISRAASTLPLSVHSPWNKDLLHFPLWGGIFFSPKAAIITIPFYIYTDKCSEASIYK